MRGEARLVWLSWSLCARGTGHGAAVPRATESSEIRNIYRTPPRHASTTASQKNRPFRITLLARPARNLLGSPRARCPRPAQCPPPTHGQTPALAQHTIHILYVIRLLLRVQHNMNHENNTIRYGYG